MIIQEKIVVNLQKLISELKAEKSKVYKGCTTVEIIQNHSYHLCELDGKISGLEMAIKATKATII